MRVSTAARSEEKKTLTSRYKSKDSGGRPLRVLCLRKVGSFEFPLSKEETKREKTSAYLIHISKGVTLLGQ